MKCTTNARISKITVGEKGFDIVIHVVHGLLMPQELSDLAKAAGNEAECFDLTLESVQMDLPLPQEETKGKKHKVA